MIVVNFNRVLMNEQIWDQPKRFMPERFIDKDGKVFMPDHFLPFSFGNFHSPRLTTSTVITMLSLH